MEQTDKQPLALLSSPLLVLQVEMLAGAHSSAQPPVKYLTCFTFILKVNDNLYVFMQRWKHLLPMFLSTFTMLHGSVWTLFMFDAAKALNELWGVTKSFIACFLLLLNYFAVYTWAHGKKKRFLNLLLLKSCCHGEIFWWCSVSTYLCKLLKETLRFSFL